MKDSRPHVTVIVMTYNQEDTIARALDSVLSQEGDVAFEILIGDDASTDRTREICENYVWRYPDRVRLMPSAPNKGVVDNYFDCLEQARGKYITDCSGDDYWIHSRKIAEMSAILDARPEVNVVYSDWIIEDISSGTRVAASELPRYRRLARDPRPMLVKILDHTDALPYNLSASMYRKESLMGVLRRTPDVVRCRRFGCEDLPVMAALATVGEAVSIPEATLVYSTGGESVSNGADRVRLARFYAGSLYASHVMARVYGVEENELRGVFRTKLKYISSAAFFSGDKGLRKEVDTILRDWSLRPDAKTRIRKAITDAHLAGPLSRRLGSAMLRVFRRKK